MATKKSISSEEAVDSANEILAAKRASKQKMDSNSQAVGKISEIVLPVQKTFLKEIKLYPGKVLKRDKYKHRNGEKALCIKKGVKWDEIPAAIKTQFRFVDEDFE